MTWNYRVIRRKYDDGTVLHQMHEVYYDKRGKPESCTVEPVRVLSETGVPGIHWTLEKMREATGKPVLDYDADFPKGDTD